MIAIDPTAVPYAVAGVVAGIVLFGAIWAVRRAFRRGALRARMDRAARGEREGGELLAREGYTILGRQCAASWEVRVDGDAVAIPLRADYLVARGGLRFVAEVKTGRDAPRVESAATRRQLLEYSFAFDVDGVLLVDAEAHSIRKVVFATQTTAPAREAKSSTAWLVLAWIAGMVAVAVTARVL